MLIFSVSYSIVTILVYVDPKVLLMLIAKFYLSPVYSSGQKKSPVSFGQREDYHDGTHTTLHPSLVILISLLTHPPAIKGRVNVTSNIWVKFFEIVEAIGKGFRNKVNLN